MAHPYHEPPLSSKKGRLTDTPDSPVGLTTASCRTQKVTCCLGLCACCFGKDKTIGTENIAGCLEVGGEDWLQRAQGNSRLMEIFCILTRMVVTGRYSFVKPQRTVPLNAVCTLIGLTLQKTLGSGMFPSHGCGHGSLRVSCSLHFSLCLFSVFPSILR